MDDVDHHWSVRPITAAIVFPLHQRQLTLVQRHARGAALVAGASMAVIGLLFVVGGVTKGGAATVAIGVGLIVAAVLAVIASAFVGRFTSATGMVTLQPDRLEIADDRHLAHPIVLLRHQIVAVCSPGMAHEQPGLRRHLADTTEVYCLGEARPNIEVWLSTPMERPRPAAPPRWPRRPVAAVQMLTPGAAVMIDWFRSGLTERHRSLMAGITDEPGFPTYDS